MALRAPVQGGTKAGSSDAKLPAFFVSGSRMIGLRNRPIHSHIPPLCKGIGILRHGRSETNSSWQTADLSFPVLRRQSSACFVKGWAACREPCNMLQREAKSVRYAVLECKVGGNWLVTVTPPRPRMPGNPHVASLRVLA